MPRQCGETGLSRPICVLADAHPHEEVYPGEMALAHEAIELLSRSGSTKANRFRTCDTSGSGVDQRRESVAARTSAATTTRALLILSFVDLQRPTVEVRAVQRLHGTGCVGI